MSVQMPNQGNKKRKKKTLPNLFKLMFNLLFMLLIHKMDHLLLSLAKVKKWEIKEF